MTVIPDFDGSMAAFNAMVGSADENGCRPWLGKRSPNGKPFVRVSRKHWRAERYGWLLFKGPIKPENLIWPTCGNPECMNMDHFSDGACTKFTPERIFASYRCGYAEYLEILKAGGTKRYATARYGAERRGIDFHLTLPEWWNIWQQSGHWSERGLHGFQMCRNGDVGPYAVGNVYIARVEVNRAEAIVSRRAKCSGIFPTEAGRFAARIRVKGHEYHLGVRSTKEQARALYLQAVKAVAASPDGNLPTDLHASRKTIVSRKRALISIEASATQVPKSSSDMSSPSSASA